MSSIANELRKRQAFIGGLVEDNPLTSGATLLTSAGLAAITGGVASTAHLAIVFDPDGVDGAPEIAYITDLTNGAGATGASGLLRGQEGTTAREHLRDTPWVHTLTVRDLAAGRLRQFLRTGGNLTLNSTSWADLPTIGTTWDATLPAYANDIVEVGVSSRVDNEAVELYLDAVTIVSAAAVNSVGSQAAPSGTTRGVGAWTALASVVGAVGGSALYRLQSGDISSSTVTLRLRYRTSSATNKTLNAVADYPLHFWVKNHGPELV